MILAHFTDYILEFGAPSGSLVLFDSSSDRGFELIGTGREMLHSLGLIDFGHLLAEISRSGVNHEIDVSILILVKLDEVIPSAERTYGFLYAGCVFKLTVAIEFGQELLCLTIDLHLVHAERSETVFILTHPHA